MLRPDGVDLVQVRVLLTVVASLGTLAGGDEVGEIGGRVVPAEMVRELLRLLDPRNEAAQPEPEPESEPESHLLADPDPVPVEALEAWASSADGVAWLHEFAVWGRDSDEVERRILSGDLALLDPDRAPPGPAPGPAPGSARGPAPGSGSRDGPPAGRTSDPAGGDGWWAAADRAVHDASLAVRRVEEAIGHASRFVRTAAAADTADEADFQTGSGRFTAADDSLAVLRACTDAQRGQLAELLDATSGGGLLDRPRLALTDALTGALVSLTDLPEARRAGHCGTRACRRYPARCTHDLGGRPGLGPPGPTDGYRPGARLDRFLRARARRCRQPGCRRPVPGAGELDHHRPYPDGPTNAGNLTGFCTGHHRGKHQAPGWAYDLDPTTGVLAVTTPTGLVATTEPPPF